MPHNNSFLYPVPVIVNGHHTRECFCSVECRARSVQEVLLLHDIEEMYGEYYRVIPRQQNEQLNRLFAKTKKKILFGYSFRMRCLHNTGYTSFGAWLANEPRYQTMSLPDKRDLCKKIRWATKVFRDWEKIVHNLTNPCYQYIEARKFSVEQFYRSRSDTWVEKQNRLLAPQTASPRIIPHFNEAKMLMILEFIKNTGIIDDVLGEDEQLQLICKHILEGLKTIRDSTNT